MVSTKPVAEFILSLTANTAGHFLRINFSVPQRSPGTARQSLLHSQGFAFPHHDLSAPNSGRLE
jgi:hypothetical protein